MGPSDATLFVGIGGGTGSGKSTLAERLSDALGAPVLRVDDYYADQADLSMPARLAVNYDAPESVDARLLAAHLDALGEGRAIEKPMYDFTAYTRSILTETVAPAPVILIEGIFALVWPEVNHRLSRRIFVDAPAQVRFERRLHRDTRERGRDEAEVRARFWGHVAPMHERWVEPTKRHADLVVSGVGSIEAMVDAAMAHLNVRARTLV